MTEKWESLRDFDYEVSNLGRIRRNGRILKPVNFGKGYDGVFLYRNGKLKRGYIHRLVAEVFIPNTDYKPQVNHKNGIKSDNRVENLEWVTDSQNRKHAYKELSVGHQSLLTFDGVTMNQSDWGKHVGIRPRTISFRLKSGWSIERTLTTPVRKTSPKIN